MRITIGEHNCLHTTLYTKPNTKNQLLLLSSAHPPSVTRSSAYSLFLRLKGICSDEEAFTEEAEKLPSKLEARRKKTRGWWRQQGVGLVSSWKQGPWRKWRSKRPTGQGSTGWSATTTFACVQPCEESWKTALGQHAPGFPSMPKPAFRRVKTLREELVRSRLPGRELRTRAGFLYNSYLLNPSYGRVMRLSHSRWNFNRTE